MVVNFRIYEISQSTPPVVANMMITGCLYGFNFRIHEISQSTRKVTRTPILIIISI
jgi:hypothetical protein